MDKCCKHLGRFPRFSKLALLSCNPPKKKAKRVGANDPITWHGYVSPENSKISKPNSCHLFSFFFFFSSIGSLVMDHTEGHSLQCWVRVMSVVSPQNRDGQEFHHVHIWPQHLVHQELHQQYQLISLDKIYLYHAHVRANH